MTIPPPSPSPKAKVIIGNIPSNGVVVGVKFVGVVGEVGDVVVMVEEVVVVGVVGSSRTVTVKVAEQKLSNESYIRTSSL